MEVRNLQGSPVNKAAEMEIEREKQIDGLRTRPRRGRRGRRPPFFFFFFLSIVAFVEKVYGHQGASVQPWPLFTSKARSSLQAS